MGPSALTGKNLFIYITQNYFSILLSLPGDEKDKEENDSEIVLMKLIQEGSGYSFETIEDDDEFERVSEYIENLDEE